MEKFDGENEKVPSVDHRLLFNSFYEILGNIMSHCFVVVGYFPPRLQGKSHGYDMAKKNKCLVSGNVKIFLWVGR